MLQVIPKPNGLILEKNGFCVLPKQFDVKFNGFQHWCLEAFWHRTGTQKTEGRPWLKLIPEPLFEEEEYRLVVDKVGATIWAAEERGIVWALTTLYQRVDSDGKIPLCEIRDQPKYKHRGLSLDCARHFFQAEIVKQIIEQISLVKMNVLHWHLTDDQGWRIESKTSPKLHQTSKEYYTQEEIRGIVRFAQSRGVEVIPEIDLPGHTTALLAAYPQYSCFARPQHLGNQRGVYPVILCAGKDSTFDFLEALFEEICPLFPSSRFHVGGDEAPKGEWKKCPHCRRRIEAEGIQDEESLQGYFTARIENILKKYGKKIICWDDTLKTSYFSEQACMQHWTFQHEPQMQAYLETGREWIYSSSYRLYLDYPHGMLTLKKIYKTSPVIGWQDCSNAKGLLGMEACLWAEDIDALPQLGAHLFPRVYALAEAAWTHERDYAAFRKRLVVFLEKLGPNRIKETPETWWDPEEDAGFQEGIHYLKKTYFSPVAQSDNSSCRSELIDMEFWKTFLRGYYGDEDFPAVFEKLTKEIN